MTKDEALKEIEKAIKWHRKEAQFHRGDPESDFHYGCVEGLQEAESYIKRLT